MATAANSGANVLERTRARADGGSELNGKELRGAFACCRASHVLAHFAGVAGAGGGEHHDEGVVARVLDKGREQLGVQLHDALVGRRQLVQLGDLLLRRQLCAWFSKTAVGPWVLREHSGASARLAKLERAGAHRATQTDARRTKQGGRASHEARRTRIARIKRRTWMCSCAQPLYSDTRPAPRSMTAARRYRRPPFLHPTSQLRACNLTPHAAARARSSSAFRIHASPPFSRAHARAHACRVLSNARAQPADSTPAWSMETEMERGWTGGLRAD